MGLTSSKSAIMQLFVQSAETPRDNADVLYLGGSSIKPCNLASPRPLVFFWVCADFPPLFSLETEWLCQISSTSTPTPISFFFFFFSIVGRQLGLSFAENLEVLLSLTSLLCPLAFFPHLFCWFSPASKDKPTSCVPKSFSVLLL